MGLVTSLTRSADRHCWPLSISSLIYGSSGCFNRRKNALGLLFQLFGGFEAFSAFWLLAGQECVDIKATGGQGVVLVNT
jgi:hypothetical protein